MVGPRLQQVVTYHLEEPPTDGAELRSLLLCSTAECSARRNVEPCFLSSKHKPIAHQSSAGSCAGSGTAAEQGAHRAADSTVVVADRCVIQGPLVSTGNVSAHERVSMVHPTGPV